MRARVVGEIGRPRLNSGHGAPSLARRCSIKAALEARSPSAAKASRRSASNLMEIVSASLSLAVSAALAATTTSAQCPPQSQQWRPGAASCPLGG